MHDASGKLGKVLASFDYELPESSIAQKPSSPRDNARLMTVQRKTGKTSDAVFSDIGSFLPQKSLIVINDTKVIPARLQLRKSTGGAVEVLYLGHDKTEVQAMVSPGLKPGTQLFLGERMVFTVEGSSGKFYRLKAHMHKDRVIPLFERHGVMPIPPYIKHSPLGKAQMKRAYQTVFAARNGSVAAPTASLHFTKRLLARLKNQGHEILHITLHVNLGTFAPLEYENIRMKRLHEEHYYISGRNALRLTRAIAHGEPIIACGTTVARTLESATRVRRGRATVQSGWHATDLFIAPGFSFRAVTGLITNFHLPQSSLLMLVAAFAGKKHIMDAYRTAVAGGYRFYSFGDAMFIS